METMVARVLAHRAGFALRLGGEATIVSPHMFIARQVQSLSGNVARLSVMIFVVVLAQTGTSGSLTQTRCNRHSEAPASARATMNRIRRKRTLMTIEDLFPRRLGFRREAR